MFVPETFTVTHVPETVPCVHPVVRPTLLIKPLKFVLVLSCSVIVKKPDVVSDPVLTPVVFAITPLSDATSTL